MTNFRDIESATRVASGNIAGSKVTSGKKKDTLFTSSFIGNNVGYVSSSTRTDMSQGVIKATGIATDFSFSGETALLSLKKIQMTQELNLFLLDHVLSVWIKVAIWSINQDII